jgi:alpha-galactosidase
MTAAKMVATYKRIRNTVQLGDLYRLYSPRAGDLTANQYVAADGKQSVLFAFLHSQEYSTAPPTIHLQGLDPRAVYRLESIDNKLAERQPQLSGAYLMQAGLNVTLRGDFDSTAVILEKVQ